MTGGTAPGTDGTGEMVVHQPADDNWVDLEDTGGLRVHTYFEHPETGASIAPLDVPKGAGIPVRHRHASNQFIYMLKGICKYLEPEPGLTLEAGAFYMNPEGGYHGPTEAVTDCLILEIYDGAHYGELPPYHTAETVGRIDRDR